MNFYDDPTHIRVVPTGELAGLARRAGWRLWRRASRETGCSRRRISCINFFRRAARNTRRARIGWAGRPA